MDLEEYFRNVSEGVDACIERNLQVQDYIEKMIDQNPRLINDIVNIRKEFLNQKDKDDLTGYLDIGYFQGFNSEGRMALFSYLFDISRALASKSLKVRFEPYRKDHAIFSKDESLYGFLRKRKNYSIDNQLIDAMALNCVYGSEVFERNGFYYKLDQALNPAIFASSKGAFPNSPIYIRLDPQKI